MGLPRLVQRLLRHGRDLEQQHRLLLQQRQRHLGALLGEGFAQRLDRPQHGLRQPEFQHVDHQPAQQVAAHDGQGDLLPQEFGQHAHVGLQRRIAALHPDLEPQRGGCLVLLPRIRLRPHRPDVRGGHAPAAHQLDLCGQRLHAGLRTAQHPRPRPRVRQHGPEHQPRKGADARPADRHGLQQRIPHAAQAVVFERLPLRLLQGADGHVARSQQRFPALLHAQNGRLRHAGLVRRQQHALETPQHLLPDGRRTAGKERLQDGQLDQFARLPLLPLHQVDQLVLRLPVAGVARHGLPRHHGPQRLVIDARPGQQLLFLPLGLGQRAARPGVQLQRTRSVGRSAESPRLVGQRG